MAGAVSKSIGYLLATQLKLTLGLVYGSETETTQG